MDIEPFSYLTLSTNLQLSTIRPVQHRHTIRLCFKPRAVTPDSLTGTQFSVKYHSSKSRALYFYKHFADIRVFSLFACFVIRGQYFLLNLLVECCYACSVGVLDDPCSIRPIHSDDVIFTRFKNLREKNKSFTNL